MYGYSAEPEDSTGRASMVLDESQTIFSSGAIRLGGEEEDDIPVRSSIIMKKPKDDFTLESARKNREAPDKNTKKAGPSKMLWNMASNLK